MIHYTETDNIAVLAIEAEGRNAIGIPDMQQMAAYIRENQERTDGFIITGKNQSLCSGLALQTGEGAPSKEEQFEQLAPELDNLLRTIAACKRPIVCALTGHAIGAGMLIMAAADCVLALDNPKAKFGLPEVMLDLRISPLMASVLQRRFTKVQIIRMLTAPAFCKLDQLQAWDAVEGTYQTEDELMDAAIAYTKRIAPHRQSFAQCKSALYINEKYAD